MSNITAVNFEPTDSEKNGQEDAPSPKRPRKADSSHSLAEHQNVQSPEFLDFGRSKEIFNLLIACTGSVASMKLPELVSEVKKSCGKHAGNIRIKIVVTDKALKFFDRKIVEEPIYDDEAEWTNWKKRGDPVLHIELRRWADALVIAPLDANTLAKIANGLCDNLVTCVVRAWDFRRPAFICPAMNSVMWDHPLTFKHMDVLKGLLGFREIPCVEKQLICGDLGYGAMAPVQMIASVLASEVKKRFAIYSS